MSNFNQRQLELIETGKANIARLQQVVEVALGVRKTVVTVKRHAYIYSLPGVGKTYTTAMTAAAHGVELVPVLGSTSIPSLARTLAFAKANMEPDTELVVWIDDCDVLFMDEEALNVMKGALDENVNKLSWNKNIGGQINRDLNSSDPNTRMMGEAMKKFQVPGSPGVTIPTNDVRFIITSNKDLCAPSKIYVPGKKIGKRDMHEGALRDRVNYSDFVMNSSDSWGWAASVLLQEECDIGVALTMEEKQLLLQFMYSHWPHLSSTSMRGVKDLAAVMKNNPTNYPALWEQGLTR